MAFKDVVIVNFCHLIYKDFSHAPFDCEMAKVNAQPHAQIHRQYWRQLFREEKIREALNAVGSSAEDDANTLFSVNTEKDSNYINWEAFRQRVKIVLQAGIDPRWLFDVGNSLNTATHGPLGLAALAAENVEQAVKILAAHTSSRETVVNVRLENTESHSTLFFEPAVRTDEFYYLFENAIQLIIAQIIAAMAQPQTENGLQVYYTNDNPLVQQALRDIGEFPKYFNRGQSKIVISEQYLKLDSEFADKSTCEANLLKCYKDKVLSFKDERPLPEKIQSLFHDYIEIRKLEVSNQLPASASPTAETSALELNMSVRTLHRKLRETDNSFKTLWQSYRQKISQQLLLEGKLSIAQIAELLGYQDTANFVRAFKQWTKLPPAQWRNEQRKTSSN